MLSKTLFVALLSIALGAKPLTFDSSLVAFTKTHTVSGSVENGTGDGTVIEVTDSSVRKLKMTLELEQGNADLIVISVAGNSKENMQEIYWGSFQVGDDYLEINKDDEQFTDGKGLLRPFVIVVVGASKKLAEYTLTIEAEGASEWRSDSTQSLEAHLKQVKKSAIWTVKSYEGDMTKFIQIATSSESTYWPYITGTAILITAGFWVWRTRNGMKSDSLSYSLIGA